MTIERLDGMLAPIGGAILDSFWWITAAAVGLAVFLRVAERVSPQRRYLLAGAALLTAPAAFLFSFPIGGPAGMPLLPSLTAAPLPEAIGGGSFAGTDWPRPLAIAWLCGVLLLSMRTFGGWVYLRILIRRATPCERPPLGELGERIGLRRRVELRSTDRADSPFTTGWRRPVIVVPLATLAGLPADQLEAILLHELAHIRRYDYVAEWALQAMETVFFYHPAVWWMTSMLRKERERTCDDMAIASGVDRACYAKALLSLEEMRVPAFANGGAGSDLGGRVARLLGKPPRSSAWPVIALLTLTVLAPTAPLVLAQIPRPYIMWLNEDAAYIMAPEERRAFESLRSAEECEKFIIQFWERRDPTPGTAKNEAKEEHYRRIHYSNERFKETGSEKSGWQTEKGRTYIVFGPPDEIESHPAQNYEQWYYKHIDGVGSNVIFEFGARRGGR